MVVEFHYFFDDSSPLLSIHSVGAFEGIGERVAQKHAYGSGRVPTAGEDVGLVFLQNHLLDVVEGVAVIVISQQCIEALVVVGSLAPSSGCSKVVVGQDASLWCTAELGGAEGIVGFGCLVGLTLSFESPCLIDVDRPRFNWSFLWWRNLCKSKYYWSN